MKEVNKMIKNKFQKEAIPILANSKSKKGLLVMPTSTGKTFVAVILTDIWYKRKKNMKILWVCHRAIINEQTFERNYNIHLPDLTYGDYPNCNNNVTFITIQTLVNHYKEYSKKYFDYIVVDEAHHYSANTWSKPIKYFTPKFLLGLTATPDRMDGRDLSNLFGKKLYDKDISDAIKYRIVGKINYIATDNDIDWTNVRLVSGKIHKKDLHRKFCIKELDEAILKDFRRQLRGGNKKFLFFCATVSHSKRMEKFFNLKGYKIRSITGCTADEERCNIIQDFESNKINIISTVDVFNEGMHLNNIDCIFMLRPTYSETIFTQQIGRGLTQDTSKQLTVVDFAGNAYNALNNNFLSTIVGTDVVEEIKNRIKEKRVNNKETSSFDIVGIGGKVTLSHNKIQIVEDILDREPTICGGCGKLLSSGLNGRGEIRKFHSNKCQSKYNSKQAQQRIVNICEPYKGLLTKYHTKDFLNCDEIGKKLKINPWMIQDYLKHIGIKIFHNAVLKKMKRLKQLDIKSLIYDYDKLKLSGSYIMEKYHIWDGNEFEKICKDNGIHIRSRGEQYKISCTDKVKRKIKKSVVNWYRKPKNKKLFAKISAKAQKKRWANYYKSQSNSNIKYFPLNPPLSNIEFEKQEKLIFNNNRNKSGTIPFNNKETQKYDDKGKIYIRSRIVERINNGDQILILESDKLKVIKEILKQKKKPSKIVIVNDNGEGLYDELNKFIKHNKVNFKIEIYDGTIEHFFRVQNHLKGNKDVNGEDNNIKSYLLDNRMRKYNFDLIWHDGFGVFDKNKHCFELILKNYRNVYVNFTYSTTNFKYKSTNPDRCIVKNMKFLKDRKVEIDESLCGLYKSTMANYAFSLN